MSLPLTKGGGGYFYLSMPWRIQPIRKLKSRWIFCGISRVVFMKVSRRSLRLQVSRQKLAARIFHSAEYKLWVQDFKFVNSKFKNRRKNPIFFMVKVEVRHIKMDKKFREFVWQATNYCPLLQNCEENLVGLQNFRNFTIFMVWNLSRKFVHLGPRTTERLNNWGRAQPPQISRSTPPLPPQSCALLSHTPLASCISPRVHP